MSYEVVIPARNEEDNIVATIKALKNQSLSPRKIIVVDDGSNDFTYIKAKKYADIVIHQPDRGFNALGTAEIPKVFNAGLRRVSLNSKFVLICSADAILPSNYFEKILKEMRSDPKLVIASGGLKTDEFFQDSHPRGTRVVRTDFWRSINNLQYPEKLGWEDWLVYKAYQKGFNARRIPGLYTTSKRNPFKTKIRIAYSHGKTMRILGYYWLYALTRAIKFFYYNPKSGIKMIAGYLSTLHEEKLDVADWLKSHQKMVLLQRVRRHILHSFRKP
jgi:glycosyltransferase involved in cell wall biosynthesis